MNKLEQQIFRAACEAQDAYKDLTDGFWLLNGPESFLQNFVALALRGEYLADTEASPRKIRNYYEGKPKRGRPSKNLNKRFDLVVWWDNGYIRAIIEVKRIFSNIGALAPDAKKIRQYAKGSNVEPFSGYILFYSEAKRRSTLENRIIRASASLNAKITGKKVVPEEEEDWLWSMALLKLQ